MSFFSLFRRRQRPEPPPQIAVPDMYSPVLPALSGERRFRDDVPYVLPKDLDEEHRLNFQHYALRSALQGNFLAPLPSEQPLTILDVGSGSGVWAEEMKQHFPSAQVVGLDIEPPAKPGAYDFVLGNVLQGLPFPEETFDFVHQRLLIGAIPAAAWPEVIRELMRVTRRAGWIELIESDGTGFHPAGPRTREMMQGVIRLAARRGIDTTMTATLDQLLLQAGLRQVSKREFPLPVGQWGGRIGSLMLSDMRAIEQSFKDGFVALFHYTPEQFDALLADVVREWEAYRSLYIFYGFVGQKV